MTAAAPMEEVGSKGLPQRDNKDVGQTLLDVSSIQL